MSNYYKALIIVPVVVLLALGGLYLYLNSSSAPRGQLVPIPVETPAPEYDSQIEVGTERVSAGSKFVNVEGGLINYTEDGVSKSVPLNQDEIALQCTKQSLIGLSEVDPNQIKDVSIVTSSELVGRISQGTQVVVIIAEPDTNPIAYSIITNDMEACD